MSPFFIFLPPEFVAFGFAILLVAIFLNRDVLAWLWKKRILPGRIPGARWAAGNVLPGVLLSVLFLVIAADVGEGYLRTTQPFLSSNWPARFDPRFGCTFIPGPTLRLTNHIGFWAVNLAHSLGFLDRQPPKSLYPKAGTCRVALIGDSFVEAAQVPIGKKVQVRLDKIAKKNDDDPKLQTMAFGFSGTGQVNQLPFYDVFARRYHPNLVVLVVVDNDFANNSSVLESVRNGWDPVYPPRLFYKRDANGTISDVSIDPNWEEKLFPRRRVAQDWLTSLHRTLLGHSYFYNWLFARTQLGFPRIARWIDGAPFWTQVYARREREVEQHWGKRFDLSGWAFPNEWDMEEMFFAQHLAPVFQKSLKYTGHAFDHYLERSARDGVHILILADKSRHLPNVRHFKIARPKIFAKNPLSKTCQIDRLKSLARPRHIPRIDFYAYIKSIHKGPRLASYAHNGHWSPLAGC